MERKVLYLPMFKTGWFWRTFAKLRVVVAGGRGDERERDRTTYGVGVGSFVAVRLKAAEEEAMPQQQGSGVGGGGGDVNGVLSWLPLLVSGLVVAHLLAFVSFVSFAPVPYGRLFSPLSLSLVEFGVFTQLLRRSL
jgi:hypothetical protein